MKIQIRYDEKKKEKMSLRHASHGINKIKQFLFSVEPALREVIVGEHSDAGGPTGQP